MELNIQHDTAQHVFYIDIEGQRALLQYHKLSEERLDYYHTFVPPQLRNRGIAAKLTQFALMYAKEHHYKVTPSCPFVQSYINAHPEINDLL